MGTPRRPQAPKTPVVGSEGAWRPSMGYIAVALVLAASGIGYLMTSPASPSASNEGDTAATTDRPYMTAASTSANAVADSWPIQATVPTPKERPMAPDTRPTQEGDNDPTPDISSHIPRGTNPSMNDVIDRLHQAGIQTGLGAFNPPGTRPPMVGLAVPENFVLPKGYVRHHQATDDGQRIEAILMYAPDQQVLDANNQPIAIPADRVVPKELAPAGVPIRQVVIPAPIDPGRAGL